MNCIFCCIFNEEHYINMLFILLESLFVFGNLTSNNEILIYTSSTFMEKIKQSNLFYSEFIKFKINDSYTSVDEACKARLDLFDFTNITKYDKILYLDTDIVIKDDINKVFDVCNDDLLYAFEEGVIDHESDYWGKSLFTDEEMEKYDNKRSFTSGVLLFKNCKNMHFLFEKIKEDMKTRTHFFHDQPFIIYNAFKYQLFNNTDLNDFITNNNPDIHSKYVIHHFPGGPGVYQYKLVEIVKFSNTLKNCIINNNIENTKKYINQYLFPIIKNCGENLEGNIFTEHNTMTYTELFLNKTKNISNVVLNKNIKNVMEIGFNAGFSTLLMLMSNPNLSVKCFDLGEHSYTLPCFNKMKETFGDRIDIIIGDSTKTVKNEMSLFDVIHIDGGHSTEVAKCDIENSLRLSKKGTIIIMDDYNFGNLHELWDNYVESYDLQKLSNTVFDSEHHDIRYVKKTGIRRQKIVFKSK